MISVRILFPVLLTLAFTGCGGADRTPGSLPQTKHAMVVIAHRGNHVSVPENTLAAYRQAIAAGADYVETDLRTTKDGQLVILHDATVKRMTGAEGAVSELTFEQIEKLVIHSQNKADTTAYHIPRFEDVLKVCKGYINIYLDFKEADVAKTYALIKAAGMEKQVVVYLNKEEQYAQWKKVAPHMPLMASIPEEMNVVQRDSLLREKPVSVVDNAYHAEEVQALHEKKIAVWLDVESESEGPNEWDQALQLGVDGLQTDHPADLIQYLEQKGIR